MLMCFMLLLYRPLNSIFVHDLNVDVLSSGNVHSFSNGRAGYSHPNQHRQSGHEREEERGDVSLSTIGFKLRNLLSVV